MANVNSLTSSSASGTTNLYGTRNVLTGLASGMDTEAMIENSVSGYKTKITQLEKEQTTYQWKQDAYRSITDKMYDLTQKYTSYTSKTNLYSQALFNNAITTTPVGENAAKVSASGRSSSDVQILAAQAATAARYNVSASAIGLNGSNTTTTVASLSGTVPVGQLKGSMTLNYDGQKIEISFDETDIIDNRANPVADSKTLVEAIRDKLSEATIKTKYGTMKASEVIQVGESGGKITFTENASANQQGATPYISSMDSNLQSALGATSSELYAGSGTKKYTLSSPDSSFVTNQNKADYLAGKDINVTVDGVTKSFRLDKTLLSQNKFAEAFNKGFQEIGVNITATADTPTSSTLSFATSNTTSQFSITTKDEQASELLFGSGDAGVSNFLNSKSSIETLLGNGFTFTQTAESDTDITGRLVAEGDYFRDKTTGNLYRTDGTNYFRVNEQKQDLYEMKINGKSVYVAKESSLDSVLDAINSSDAGVNASFSKLTGKFVFTAKETGVGSKIEFGNTLTQSLFGSTNNPTQGGTYTQGTDATVRALVNDELVTLERSSNTIDFDGMKVTLNGSFNTENLQNRTVSAAEKQNAVSFTTSGGSDDLVKTITSFVDEYNAVLKELHDAYATQPAEKSAKNHTRYEPLSDDDKEGMSDKAIESYEAKAKQGILFGDSDLRAAYESMTRAISPGGSDGAALRNMGIETTYSGGLTLIKLDESKLREALNKDPDSVKNAFTKSKEGGASSDGLMSSIKSIMEQYGSTSYSSPGILVKKAGSTHNATSLLNNDMQKQLDSIQTKIEQWQTKMSSKIDYYTRQFTALEKLMNTMNSQSSALAGLMGG